MKKLLNKNVRLFLIITFGAVWLTMLVAFIIGVRYGDEAFTWILNIAMLIPALALLIIRRLSNEALGLENMYAHPHFALRTIKTYVFAYILPILCMILGAAVFFVLNPSLYQADAADYINVFVESGFNADEARARFTGQLLMSFLLGPLMSVFFSFFEEIGFRGFLLREVQASLNGKNTAIKATLIVSACWALWYVPMLALGFRYGDMYDFAPLLGILIGVVVFFLIGIVASYLSFRTGSSYAAALFRSGIQSLAIVSGFFIFTNPHPDNYFNLLTLLSFTFFA